MNPAAPWSRPFLVDLRNAVEVAPLPTLYQRKQEEWLKTLKKLRSIEPEAVLRPVREWCQLNNLQKKVRLASVIDGPVLEEAHAHRARRDSALLTSFAECSDPMAALTDYLASIPRERRDPARVWALGEMLLYLGMRKARKEGRMSDAQSRRWSVSDCSAAGASFYAIARLDTEQALLQRLVNQTRWLSGFGELDRLLERLSALTMFFVEAVRAGLGWVFETNAEIVVVPRPIVWLDPRLRFHRTSGPALVWGDGTGEYFWRDLHLTEKHIRHPERLSADEILDIRNVELRRWIISRIGFAELLNRPEVEVLDEDVDYGGRRQLLRLNLHTDEPLVAVRVICPSTQRNYLLRVPPAMRSCQEAIAWTFGIERARYRPVIET